MMETEVKLNKIINSSYFGYLADDKGMTIDELAEHKWTYKCSIETILNNERENMINGGNCNWVNLNTIELISYISNSFDVRKKSIDNIIKEAIKYIDIKAWKERKR